MLKVEGLTKSFRKAAGGKSSRKAVDHVSFEVKKGTALGLVGASGCGKSTLARLVLKLLQPEEGRIFFGGEDITDLDAKGMKPIRRKMQVIFQHPESALNPSLRILDSLLEPMEFHKLHHRDARMEKVMRLASMAGIHPNLLDRYPQQVSGGEIQRLVIARALTLDPEFLVLDEPTSMLDVSVQAQVLQLLKSLQSELGLTYLFISHDLEVVSWFSDRIAVMRDGKLIENGTPEEICKHPGEAYTREFVNTFFSFSGS